MARTRKLIIFVITVAVALVWCLNLACSEQADEAPAPQTLYITETGEKYHLESCGNLSRSKIETTLEDAVKYGYEPCKTCKPPE